VPLLVITRGTLALAGLGLSCGATVTLLEVGLGCVVLIFMAGQMSEMNVQVRACDGLLALYRGGAPPGAATFTQGACAHAGPVWRPLEIPFLTAACAIRDGRFP